MKSRLSGIIFVFLMIFLSLGGVSTPASAATFDYSVYRTLLEKNVIESGQSTKVKYAALKKDPSKLIEFNKSVSAISLSEFKGWPKNEQIAFLINAYNSFTLQIVVQHYPVSSIKKIGGIFGNPWKKKFFQFLGVESSLDRIEHEILRKDYKEPRIHFAVNCASIGCPPLQKLPFEAIRLDEQLEIAARNFVNSSNFNQYDPTTNTLNLSSIFKWYGSDFGEEKDLRKFFADRSDLGQPSKDAILKSAKISYLDYDWNLNEAK